MVSAKEIVEFVKNNIQTFHTNRLESLNDLKLKDVLKRKNPYLFKAKNITIAGDLVKNLMDSHLSSQEEAIFGNFLESLAIFVCEKSFNGKKSSAEGIDLEFNKGQDKYIVSIKSGPNWGNSSQIKRMIDNFKKAKIILRTGNSRINVVAVNGCCYGITSKSDKGEYLKLCGQSFWSFISGNDNLYIEIIEPLGHQAKERNKAFLEKYPTVINKFTQEFGQFFCNSAGEILWEKIVELNSGMSVSQRKK